VTTVPHYLHPEMTITAIGKGIHTLTEKPAGVYTKQVEEMNAFAAAHPETTFAIMFNQRTNPVYTDLKALIDSRELGKLRHTSWIITTWWRPQGYYDQSAWRATWGGEAAASWSTRLRTSSTCGSGCAARRRRSSRSSPSASSATSRPRTRSTRSS